MKNKILFALFPLLLLMNSCTKDVADSVCDSLILNPEQEEFKVFPGLTDDIIVLEGKTGLTSNHIVTFSNLSGEEIHRTNWTLLPGANRTQLNLGKPVEPGVYLIKIMGESGDYQTLTLSLNY